MFKNRLHRRHQQERLMYHRRVMMIRIIRMLRQQDHRQQPINRIPIQIIQIQAKMNRKIFAL